MSSALKAFFRVMHHGLGRFSVVIVREWRSSLPESELLGAPGEASSIS
jgi:hypothetical protein